MPQEVAEPSERLVSAIRRLLRPLVRVLIAQGIALPYLTELLKRSYVESASRHFALDKGRLTDSRLSILTGVHRKDVKRLRNEPEAGGFSQRPASFGARVVGVWSGVSAYLDEQGQPRPLSREAFEALVESISKDVRARTILDEWLRLGYVEVDDEDLLHLRADAFIPSGEFDELAFYFGRNLHDHLAAAGENLLGAPDPHLERAVYYPGFSAESVRELEQLARQQAQQALHTLNKAMQARLERDRGRGDAVHRFCFGVYSYRNEVERGDK